MFVNKLVNEMYLMIAEYQTMHGCIPSKLVVCEEAYNALVETARSLMQSRGISPNVLEKDPKEMHFYEVLIEKDLDLKEGAYCI